MENPGDIPKKDYFRVKNDWWDALVATNMPGNVRQCLDYIIRMTYGWRRKEAEIPINDFVKATGLKKSNVSRALKALKLSFTITVIKNDNQKYLTYSFNKHFEQWKPINIKYGNKKRVIIADNKELSLPITKNVKNDNSLPITRNNIIKEQLNNNAQVLSDFDIFWQEYPVKKGKQNALKKWEALSKKKLLPALQIILRAIEDQVDEKEKQRQEAAFVPEWKYPATWLNQGCWDDVCDFKTNFERIENRRLSNDKGDGGKDIFKDYFVLQSQEGADAGSN